MRANEFVKKFGYKHNAVNLKYSPLNQHAELERLVESHELVEEYGGLDKAKAQAERFRLNTCIKMHGFMCRIIADVESCQ